MYYCVKLNSKDNVATITKAVTPGEEISFKFGGEEFKITAATDIPIYHKVALEHIKKGSAVFKYGQKIGYALCDINKGAHVHTFNLASSISCND